MWLDSTRPNLSAKEATEYYRLIIIIKRQFIRLSNMARVTTRTESDIRRSRNNGELSLRSYMGIISVAFPAKTTLL